MDTGKVPTMKIPLGLSVESRPTFGDLMERAEKRITLIVAGQKVLDFAAAKSFVRGARLQVDDGNYELSAEIPTKPQADFIGNGQEKSFHPTGLRRKDEDEQQAVNEVVYAMENSSQLLDRVADAMATSPNLKAELRAIEKKEGVDTHPAQRFIYLKQGKFTVMVEDEPVPFNGHVVRADVSDGDPVNVSVIPAESGAESFVVRGFVPSSQGLGGSLGLQQSGVVHEFRFIHLQGWQKTLLEAARWLKIPIHLVARQTVSTCSLKQRPADVLQVNNWNDLLERTLLALGSIRKAQLDMQAEERRDAA
jgi:hypothetical protein